MNLPFFFVENLSDKRIVLDEDTSKHMINVLRMQNGEEVLLTDGKGKRTKASIVDDNRKKCVVEISLITIEEKRRNNVAIGISLIKNSSRFEWFLEKATEIGVGEVIPLICDRTEKEKFRFDRMQNILISAMLQSQQCWLPVLHEPTEFERAIHLSFEQKFIAHCEESNKQSLSSQQLNNSTSRIILIGPEGDFTPEEIESAIKNNFVPVSLGNTRLRTETAGMVATTLLCIH
ncbi:MAG TPA: RsmE family RNA methyltransferase [Flavisolibacter sp.]|jgi:16S rRNA (uracil1498-N3)-methyltransferase|nr:RsmE family RNA methyltransferase [Flavisolibacter sp.]